MTDNSNVCSKLIKKEVKNDGYFESWSCTQTQVVKLRHTWTIDNFSLICCQDNGVPLVSPTFSAGSNDKNLEWCLYLNPKIQCLESNDYMSLYLNLVKCDICEIEVKFKLSIVNNRGENVHSVDTSTLFKLGDCLGDENFVRREFLFNEKNQCLLNDTLTLICEIIAGVGKRNISGTLYTSQSDLTLDLGFLLHNKDLSDVTLSADGKEFPAHKVILAVHSPVFRAMFQHDMKESRNNHVKITDINEEGLYEMLSYMYTGKINNLEKMAPHLLCVAEKYAMDGLKIICEKSLFRSLSFENVVDIFILSDKFNATELKDQVKEFIAAHAAVLGNMCEFKTIFLTYPHLAMEAFCALSAD